MPQSESCRATLTFKDGDQTMTFAGRTQNQHGHAEMDALHDVIEHYVDDRKRLGRIKDSMDNWTEKLVSCPDKPVCRGCTHVLKSLGFTCKDDGTVFSDNASKNWGVSLTVRAFLNECAIDWESYRNC